MKPVLKYRGGKSKEIPHFIIYIPKNFSRYIEPFFGGGAVYFHLEPEQAIINDVNDKLMKFYIHLRDAYPVMRRQLDALQEIYENNQQAYAKEKIANPDVKIPNDNEDLYYQLRNIFNGRKSPIKLLSDHLDEEDLLDGVVYFFINKTAFSGMIRYNSDGEYNVPFGRYPHLNTNLVTYQHSSLLQKAKIYNTDYKEIFEMANADDFIFLDPPYDCVFNDYGNIGMMNGFDENEHRRLAEDFKQLPCKALMIIGRTPLTEELYHDFICDEYYKNYSVNIRNRFNNDKMHIVVKNF